MDGSQNCIMAAIHYLIELRLNVSFDDKVKALKDSNKQNKKLIEEYQVTMIYYVFCYNHAISEKKPNSRS